MQILITEKITKKDCCFLSNFKKDNLSSKKFNIELFKRKCFLIYSFEDVWPEEYPTNYKSFMAIIFLKNGQYCELIDCGDEEFNVKKWYFQNDEEYEKKRIHSRAFKKESRNIFNKVLKICKQN